MSSVSEDYFVKHQAGKRWVYVSGDPKGTLTYTSFLRGTREEGSKVEVVRTGRRLDWGGVRAEVIALLLGSSSARPTTTRWPSC